MPKYQVLIRELKDDPSDGTLCFNIESARDPLTYMVDLKTLVQDSGYGTTGPVCAGPELVPRGFYECFLRLRRQEIPPPEEEVPGTSALARALHVMRGENASVRYPFTQADLDLAENLYSMGVLTPTEINAVRIAPHRTATPYNPDDLQRLLNLVSQYWETRHVEDEPREPIPSRYERPPVI